MKRPAMKRPASARAVANAKGKTTTKGIGNDKGKGNGKCKAKGNGKGEKGNGKGNGKFDDDAAARAAIRAEADAMRDSDIEAIMFEGRTREDEYQRRLSNLQTRMSPLSALMYIEELDSRDRNVD
jgi:hypothetical protein